MNIYILISLGIMLVMRLGFHFIVLPIVDKKLKEKYPSPFDETDVTQ